MMALAARRAPAHRVTARLAALLAAALVALAAAPAPAFVLPAPHVLQLVAAKLGRARALEVHQQQVLLEDAAPQAPCPGGGPGCPEADAGAADAPARVTPVREILRYRIPDAFRVDADIPPAGRIFLWTGGRSLTLVAGVPSADPATALDLYPLPLLPRSREEMAAALAAQGVDVGLCSLGRHEGRVAFVIGAQYPDAERPQLWVDQRSFLPLRWIPSRPAAGEGIEIRYGQWRRLSDLWYPEQIDILRGQRRLRAIRAERLVVNPPLERTLFDLEALRGRSQAPPAADGRTEGGTIRRRLNELRRIFQ